MARRGRDDDLLLEDDELAAAFLGDDLTATPPAHQPKPHQPLMKSGAKRKQPYRGSWRLMFMKLRSALSSRLVQLALTRTTWMSVSPITN